MKALTLTQPWATLVALGEKRIETRSWRTDYRGELAIHAAKSFPLEARKLCEKTLFREALLRAGIQIHHALPLGVVLCRVRLADVVPTTEVRYSQLGEHELKFGDFSAGRFAWMLEQVQRFTVPVTTRGALGLWDWSPGLAMAREQRT